MSNDNPQRLGKEQGVVRHSLLHQYLEYLRQPQEVNGGGENREGGRSGAIVAKIRLAQT